MSFMDPLDVAPAQTYWLINFSHCDLSKRKHRASFEYQKVCKDKFVVSPKKFFTRAFSPSFIYY